jgi:glutaredoxin
LQKFLRAIDISERGVMAELPLMNERQPDAHDISQRIVLYTRAGCHLCDDAQQLLLTHGIVPECIDIDADPDLRERFDTCVPVVEINGKIRFRGRINPLLLRRLLVRNAPE